MLFPGDDAGILPATDVAAAKSQCVERGCGGFVTWCGNAYLRRQSTRVLRSMVQRGPGATLWLPPELCVEPQDYPLPSSYPEVTVAGAKPVEKCRALSEQAMTSRFIHSMPVVLIDAQEEWAAKERWDFEWFADRFGDEEITCSDLAPFFKLWGDGEKIQTVVLPMREYVRYVRSEPNALRPLQKDVSQVFYANAWAPFSTYDILLQDVSDRLYCVQDTIPRTPETQKFNHDLTKIFMGPAGCVSRLHHDTYATHVWLSQIRGRKQFICYPPSDAEHLHCKGSACGRTTLFDPAAPDFCQFPGAQAATPYSVVVEQGETVVLPAKWFHWAKSLTPSITLMRNFVNDVNVAEHMSMRAQTQDAHGT